MVAGSVPSRVFLRRVLYRIDFQLITEKMQEDLFAFVGQNFGDYFDTQGQEMESAIGIEINPDQIEQSRFNQKAQPVFVFSSPQNQDTDGRELKIGRTFLFLDLKLSLQLTQVPYYEWMSKIVAHLFESRMFRLSRIGLRKFNSFFILDSHKEKLNNLFSIQYLSQVDCDGFGLDSFQEMQIYNNQQYTLNFQKKYSTGKLNNESLSIVDQPAHLIAFDYDLFTTDLDELDAFAKDAKAGLEKMNGLIYSFFSKTINSDIIDLIKAGDLLEDYHVIPF